MNIKISQAFYKPEQFAMLQHAFIPYNNIKNEQPLLREYPFILDLYKKNRNFDGYWGLVSWAFTFKTKLTGEQALEMIHSNPGYDLYHFNSFTEMTVNYVNPFTQADEFHHKGMLEFINGILTRLGYTGDIAEVRFAPEQFIYCSHYIGNQYFWDRWHAFLTTCIEVAESDPKLNEYLHAYLSIHDNKSEITNFSFVVERLVSLFVHIHSSTLKIKMFECH
jgi:hypothetical protein